MKFENIKNNEQAPCPNCTCYDKCKDTISNENFEVKCIWYGWMKKNFKSIKE